MLSNKERGKLIIKRRKQLGLSQSDLAVLCGAADDSDSVSQSYIALLEKGAANPSIAILNKLAIALELTVSQLTEGGEEPPIRYSPKLNKLLVCAIQLSDRDIEELVEYAKVKIKMKDRK